MSSNSPVLLLAPSAVPTAPIMAPLLVAKSADLRARGLMPSPFQQEKPSEASSPAAVGKALSTPSLPRVETPSTPSAPPPSPIVEAAKPALPKVVSPVVAPVVPPAPQVANAAPIVAARSPAPTPTSTPTPATSPVPAVTPAAATSPARPSVAAPSMLTRATPLTPVVTTATSTPTTKRAAALAASAQPTTALTIAAPSPAASPKSGPSSPSSPKASTKSSTGRWTEAEHKLFLKGLEQFPYRAWKKIATLIKTRTVVQIRTHAQKYYQKLEKEEQRMREREAQLAAQQQQQQGAATASAAAAALSSSAVSTPRAAVLSAPSTPAAAASASFRELSLATPLVTTPSAAAAAAPHFAIGRDDAEAGVTFTGAAGKRKAPMRKRKSSADETSDGPSSLPKRMMKEKKFVREKTMSPKQKTVVAGGRMLSFADHTGSSSDAKSSTGSIRGLSTHPLDFDDADDVAASTSMILDFAEEKPIVDYPFALDSALERGLAAIDQDELLQLSDDENMDWFSAAAGEQEGEQSGDDATSATSPVSSPLSLGRNPFSPLYSEDCLQFVDPAVGASECSTPSPILGSADDCSDFAMSGDEHDEDDDFVLDPEKFLSSYFQPDASTES